jgi:hypothetical protein
MAGSWTRQPRSHHDETFFHPTPNHDLSYNQLQRQPLLMYPSQVWRTYAKMQLSSRNPPDQGILFAIA